MPAITLATPRGPARVHPEIPRGATHALVLGHGAGGGVQAPDLLAARSAALAAGVGVVLVEQPYRVAGRRSPPAAAILDEAWSATVERLRERDLRGLRLISGGRSSGARVACRTAAATEAVAVLCLAFPLQPPRRRSDGEPAPDRLRELSEVSVPVLVIQGERDRFGVPPEAPGREVFTVSGDHSLRTDLTRAQTAIGAWLRSLSALPLSAEGVESGRRESNPP